MRGEIEALIYTELRLLRQKARAARNGSFWKYPRR